MSSMKITVDLPESELQQITRITGIKKKGPAIRQLVSDALAARRRAEITGSYLKGQWSAELPTFEASRKADRTSALTLAEQWRD